MIKTFISKFLISFIVLLTVIIPVEAKQATFVSLSPALTETMYAIGAKNQLLAVSTTCTYPLEVLKKEKIGNTYFVNKEKIIKIKPDYILAVDGTQYATCNFDKIGITPLYFNMNSINAIYNAILSLGELTGKKNNALILVRKLSSEIEKIKPKQQKKILYLVQLNPFITIGNKSFISDVIRKSGQISVTDNLNEFYPAISDEFLIKTNPDVIIISFKSDATKLKKLFPNKKIIFLSQTQNDMINRPGPRVINAVQFFANL